MFDGSDFSICFPQECSRHQPLIQKFSTWSLDAIMCHTRRGMTHYRMFVLCYCSITYRVLRVARVHTLRFTLHSAASGSGGSWIAPSSPSTTTLTSGSRPAIRRLLIG